MDTYVDVKVWSCDRKTKKLLEMDSMSETILQDLIIEASTKLQINGSTIVLEKDGTPIETDRSLRRHLDETLILLTLSENWLSVDQQQFDFLNMIPDAEDSSFANISQRSSSRASSVSSVSTINSTSSNQNKCDVEKDSDAAWLNFTIPWDKISKQSLDMFESGVRTNITKLAEKELVHATIAKTRLISKKVMCKHLRLVAQKILVRYPRAFEDTLAAKVLGDGKHSMFQKLLDHNNYLNAMESRECKERFPENTQHQSKKIKLSERVGCVNWDPIVDDTVSALGTLMEKQHYLNSLISKKIIDNEQDKAVWDATYALQRQYINDKPTIESIIKDWPIIFHQSAIYWHIDSLLNVDLKIISTKLVENKTAFYKIGRKKGLMNLEAECLDENADENKDAIVLRCLKSIASYFNEKLATFLIDLPLTVSSNSMDKPLSPCIINNGKTYEIFIEKQKILESSHFSEALEQCFAFYYILNMQFPKKLPCTMEMLQRFALNINPTVGSKGKSSKGVSE